MTSTVLRQSSRKMDGTLRFAADASGVLDEIDTFAADPGSAGGPPLDECI
jgi:hypothetical protein